MFKYKRKTIRSFFVKCWWCDDEFYTEFGRFKHLLEEHPDFFEKFDEINGWIPFPFSSPNIPEKPEDDSATAGDNS
jgi:hypothetical protein